MEALETATLDELSREWGQTFLKAAIVLDLDMEDQTQRWGAFCELERQDNPVAAARRDPTSIAQACLVLRHLDGTRYVRSGWFRSYVRQEDVTVPAQEVAQRMERVGWQRRGREGWIKATRPAFQDVHRWRFYVVREGWEEGAE
jgi:hypothetical protein